MSRATRGGRIFSPYQLDPDTLDSMPPPEIISTSIDLGPFLHAALINADQQAAVHDRDDPPLDEDEDDEGWEDELDSRAPSPLSDLTSPPASRSTSPVEEHGHDE